MPCQAHRFFEKLRVVGAARTGIENSRMETHITFCHTTFQNAEAYVDKVRALAQGVHPSTSWLPLIVLQHVALLYAACARVRGG